MSAFALEGLRHKFDSHYPTRQQSFGLLILVVTATGLLLAILHGLEAGVVLMRRP